MGGGGIRKIQWFVDMEEERGTPLARRPPQEAPSQEATPWKEAPP